MALERRDQTAQPDNHRDTRDTEKYTRSTASVLQLFKIPARRGDFAVARQPSDHRRMVADAWLFVPEGRRRKLAGGKPAPAGAAPGRHAERAMPQRGIGEVFGVARPPSVAVTTRRLGQIGVPAIGEHPGPFLRCPAGARSHPARFPGAASAGAYLPPANLLRRPSGTGTGRPRTDKGKPPINTDRNRPPPHHLPNANRVFQNPVPIRVHPWSNNSFPIRRRPPYRAGLMISLILKMGRNMAMTMPPTTTPRNTMSSGSIRDVRPESVVSISSSRKSATRSSI